MLTKPVLPVSAKQLSEVEVETSGINAYLESLGYIIRARKSQISELDAAWPTKNVGGAGAGQPDLLLFAKEGNYPIVVWENKSTDVGADVALSESKQYVEGAHGRLRGKPNLPRIAVGYDGRSLKASFYTTDNRWVTLKTGKGEVLGYFVPASELDRGVQNNGLIVAPPETLDAKMLRGVFEQLKVLYRSIPALKSGRRPIDFTVALLTLRLVVERERWGSWAEQPSLVTDVIDLDQQVYERFLQLVSRCMSNTGLRRSYGSILKFREQDDRESEIAFDFEAVLKSIPVDRGYFKKMFELLDSLPMLHGADIDIFGEVYQAIGDDAVKRAFGEYFTGRHIIAGVVPILMSRASIESFEEISGKSIADIACGTGGFLTETLRLMRREFDLDEDEISEFAESSFFGYDLSISNASRARVNMYFAGDGFSVIEGGVDSLDIKATRGPKRRKFDFILTNPPYGASTHHQLIHEAFLQRTLDLLRPGTGWGMIVLPTGTLENPRSSNTRFNLLRNAQLTDVISLPKHAFAPYTTQRTGILIFRKRATPLSATTWDELLGQVGHEKVAMFVVSNDGYANSDKRFPTRRKDENGQWIHDDLAPWTGHDGIRRDSKIIEALINENGTDDAYARKSLLQLSEAMKDKGADRGSGIEFLPDNYLTEQISSISPDAFLERAGEIVSLLGSDFTAFDVGISITENLNALLATPIVFPSGEAIDVALDEIFTITKGNSNLTEAAIYHGFDANGIPVFGGGVSVPTQVIGRKAVSSKGKKITVFQGPAIILSVDGSSGAMQVVESGDFAANHHAAVLRPRVGEMDLHLIAQQAESRLKALASNKTGSATLTLGTIRSLRIPMPSRPEVSKKLNDIRGKLTNIRRAIA